MSHKTLVLSMFSDESHADEAALALKAAGLAHHDAIGVLVLDEKGQLNARKVGSTSFNKGFGIGLALMAVTPAGLAALVGGGLVGHLHHKRLGVDDADRERIGKELQGGRAALGVLASASEAPIVAATLTEVGGVSEEHVMSDEAIAETRAASGA